jgi:hypothetical protein
VPNHLLTAPERPPVSAPPVATPRAIAYPPAWWGRRAPHERPEVPAGVERWRTDLVVGMPGSHRRRRGLVLLRLLAAAAGARGRPAGARGGPRHAASRAGLPGRRQRPPGSARARVSEGAAVRQPPACVAVAQRRRARAAGAVAAAAPAVPAPAGLAVASARTVPGRPALLRRRARRAARAARVGRRARHRARVRRHPPCAGAGAGLARARRCEPAAPLRPPPAAARDRAARTVRGAERELAAAPALAGVAGARECRHRDRAPRTSSSRP